MTLATRLNTSLLYLVLPITALADADTRNKESQAYNPTIDSLTWQPHTLSEDIRVFSATVPESTFTAVLAETTINANIDRIIQLIRDTSICQQWVYRCKHSSEYPAPKPPATSHLTPTSQSAHNKPDNTNIDETYIYTLSHMPFPTKDRDVLAHITWQTDPLTHVVTSTGIATTGALPHKAPYIRIENATIIWELTPLKMKSTRIRSFAHVDPAGGIPSWLSNQLALDIPLKTLRGLKNIAEENSLPRHKSQSALPNNHTENDN